MTLWSYTHSTLPPLFASLISRIIAQSIPYDEDKGREGEEGGVCGVGAAIRRPSQNDGKRTQGGHLKI
jgi:hypothetical protein